MSAWQQGRPTTGLLIGRLVLRVAAIMLAGIEGAQIIGMGLQVLWAWFSHVSFCAKPTQILTIDFF